MMITCEGHEETIERVCRHRQEHVFRRWEELSPEEKGELLGDLAKIDFDALAMIYRQAERRDFPESDFVPAPCRRLPASAEDEAAFARARGAGLEHIKKGKTAAFVVAGGQGTRLGYGGPKGKFPIAPVSGKSIFQIHAEKILKYSRKYGVPVPFLVMTSEENHHETQAFFLENRFFGLPDGDVFIFTQNMIPSLDLEGKLILERRSRVFRNPDGHGGSLTALRTSGALDWLRERGIETLSYFQVDNPLVRIIDPVFIGFHVLERAEASSKALPKAGPGEKIGVFVRYKSGRTGVVEYSDLPEERQEEKDADGNLEFLMGSIAIHLFETSFIEKICAGGNNSLPFHIARKKISAWRDGRKEEIEGYKFEKFVFDSLPLAERSLVLETVREEEFGPVKNPSDIDSVESARELMDRLFRKWLGERGIPVPATTRTVEISPLLAVEPEDLPPGLVLPGGERIYLS